MTRNELEVIKGALNASTYMMRHSHEFKQISAALALVNAALDEPAADGWQAGAMAMREACIAWHDERRRHTPDVFESELHEVSIDTLRALPLPLPPGGRT